jgi:hypothetical protein
MFIHRALAVCVEVAGFACAFAIGCGASEGSNGNGNGLGGASGSFGQLPSTAGAAMMPPVTTGTGLPPSPPMSMNPMPTGAGGGASGAGGAASAGRPPADSGSSGATGAGAGGRGGGGATGGAASDAGGGDVGTGWVTVHNDFFWYDISGNLINVRSGTLRKFGDLFYWYGAASNLSDQTCYTSPDLVHWTYKGIVLHLTVQANRMDVLYNAASQTYVMFLKYDGNGANLGIATASVPEGPYTFISKTLVDGAKMGDMSVFEDDDGRAYLAYVSWAISTNGSHGIYGMSPDYQTLDKRVAYWTTGGREAPHIFKRDGVYYYGTSQTANIDPSATQYYMASSLAGPWSASVGLTTPGSTTTYETQCDFVVPFAGSQGTFYMYDGDRWKQNGGSQGDYVWLPIDFDAKGLPSMQYYQDWDFSPATGTWRTFDPARDLARGKTATASSASSTNTAASVTTTTTYKDYSATRWESAASDPQWIMVDLGAPTEIDRVILKWHFDYARAFSIQVSTDAMSWMTVYSATKGASYSVTDVTFNKTLARYVRMNGTQRGTQNGYSLFSFMVLDDL